MIRVTALLLALSAAVCAQNPNAAVFPSVPTDADLLVANNFYQAYLTGGIAANATSIPVTSTAGLHVPTAIVIDGATASHEIVKVCGILNPTTLTVCAGGRGFDGTSAKTHITTASVTGAPVASMYNQAYAEIKAMAAALRAMNPGPGASGTYCPVYTNGVVTGSALCSSSGGSGGLSNGMTWNGTQMTWNGGGMTWH